VLQAQRGDEEGAGGLGQDAVRRVGGIQKETSESRKEGRKEGRKEREFIINSAIRRARFLFSILRYKCEILSYKGRECLISSVDYYVTPNSLNHGRVGGRGGLR
jgi:hypothetical protein